MPWNYASPEGYILKQRNFKQSDVYDNIGDIWRLKWNEIKEKHILHREYVSVPFQLFDITYVIIGIRFRTPTTLYSPYETNW